MTQPQPAGSMAPLTSTQDGTKWHHGVDSAGITRLTKLAADINEVFEVAVRDHVKVQISMGRLLNEARTIFPGDLQFGQWRAQNTPIGNRTTASKLMNLAKQVGDGRITQEMVAKLPISNLKELLSAPDTVLNTVAEQIEAGESPTRDSIRELTREANAPTSPDDAPPASTSMLDDLKSADEEKAPETPREAPPQARGPAAPAQPAQRKAAQVVPGLLALSLIERLRALDPDKVPFDGCSVEEWAWLVLGLDPTPAYLPNAEVARVIIEHYAAQIEASRAHDTDRLQYTLQKAEKNVNDQIASDM